LGELRVIGFIASTELRVKDAFGKLFTEKKSSERRWEIRTD